MILILLAGVILLGLIGIDDLAEAAAIAAAEQAAASGIQAIYSWASGAEREASSANTNTGGTPDPGAPPGPSQSDKLDQIYSAAAGGFDMLLNLTGTHTEFSEAAIGSNYPGAVWNADKTFAALLGDVFPTDYATNADVSHVRESLNSLAHYTFDEAGIASYDADILTGQTVGDGPVVLRYPSDVAGSYPCINPRYIVFLGPDQESYINLFTVIQALTGSTRYHPDL
jgi:hypothetical protein